MSSIAVIVVVDRSMNRFYKHSFDDDDAACAVDAGYWTAQAPDLYTGPFQSRTLLQELYDEPAQDIWSQQLQQQQQQHFSPRSHEYQISRRNTYPIVRCDRDMQFQPFMNHQYPDQFSPETSLGYHDTSTIKLEDPSSILLPSNQSFYRPQPSAAVPLPMPYTPSLPIQHTDDAASKETQYLRRRCFNCHTTEPPSWRRSTLNPGKIVCNKCGLYERTHLRPRPLRFDELRAGNKHRKASKDTVSPKAKPSSNVKRVPSLLRRASVSSNGSVHSVGATSDWDENGMSCAIIFLSFLYLLYQSLSILQVQPHPPLLILPVFSLSPSLVTPSLPRTTVLSAFPMPPSLILPHCPNNNSPNLLLPFLLPLPILLDLQYISLPHLCLPPQMPPTFRHQSTFVVLTIMVSLVFGLTPPSKTLLTPFSVALFQCLWHHESNTITMHTLYLFIKKMYHHGLSVSSLLALFLNQYVKFTPLFIYFPSCGSSVKLVYYSIQASACRL